MAGERLTYSQEREDRLKKLLHDIANAVSVVNASLVYIVERSDSMPPDVREAAQDGSVASTGLVELTRDLQRLLW